MCCGYRCGIIRYRTADGVFTCLPIRGDWAPDLTVATSLKV
jgi:hypothetical protein